MQGWAWWLGYGELDGLNVHRRMVKAPTGIGPEGTEGRFELLRAES